MSLGPKPKTFYIGKPSNSTDEEPVGLSYLGQPCKVPSDARAWVVTHVIVAHTGAAGSLPGYLSLAYGPADDIGNWNLATWKESGFYRVGPFRPALVEPFPVPLRLPLERGWQLAAAQAPGTSATPLTVFITGTEH